MLVLIILSGVSISLIFFHIFANQPISSAFGFSILGYLATTYLIPRLGPSFARIGLKGTDLSKKDRPVIPECLGAVSAVVYLFLLFFFIPFLFIPMIISPPSLESGTSLFFPHSKLIQYLSAALCLQSQILLGAADDLFDVKWRHKFFMPAIAAIPLLIVYYVDFGITLILLPGSIGELLGYRTLDLGFLYYGYMAAIAIFCPNSINILAGVNGLEVGQTVVLAAIFLLNDACYLLFSSNPAAVSSHLFSVCLLVPFLGVSIALLRQNWYPAKVFVGDTFCYFAGMVFAVVAILGHFSKTLLLFFLPQIFNFVYSVPQLFHVIPCPRHRMPRFDPETGLMYPSMAVLFDEEGKIKLKFVDLRAKWPQLGLKTLSKLGLMKTEEVETIFEGKKVTLIGKINNLTLINLVLVIFGPLREDRLCANILKIQFVVGVFALAARHVVGHFLFGGDNLWT